MKKSTFTEEQIARILRETDRDPVATVAKRHGVSDQAIYTWKKRFGSFQPDDVHRLKQLEQENARLKKLVAERDIEIEVMKEIAAKNLVGVPARREHVAYAQHGGLSQRRSCTLLKVARSALDYRSTKAIEDRPVPERMAVLAAQYPRYGYRRIRIFLGRDGHPMSAGRAHRLWRFAKLQVPRRRPRKRIAPGRPRPRAPTGANQVRSYDFVFDWCANGRQLKCLTVTDEWTREGLAIEVDGRIHSGRVIEVLSRLVSERGAPLYLRSDNGPEFVSRALLKWRRWLQRLWHRDRADRSRQAMAERCAGKLQRQVPRRVSEHGVVQVSRRGQGGHRSLAQALQLRPHSSLRYLTPAQFAAKLQQTNAVPVSAMGRGAARHGGFAPRPVAALSQLGQSKEQETPVLSS
jgi:putative transposase